MKVDVNVENILKKIGEGDKPAYSLKVVKEVASHVEQLFRRAGYGIDSIGAVNPVAKPVIIEAEVKVEPDEPQAYVPKFRKCKPSTIKKGDLFMGYSVNGKARPIVVAKIVKDLAYCICLTTTEDEYTLMPHNSRFLDEGFLTNSFILVKTKYIKDNFLGVMDDTRTLNKAIKIIKDKVKSDL
jgi:ribosomal protein S16